MKIGMTDYYVKRYGLSEGAARMAAHGYSCIDYQLADIKLDLYTARDEDFLRMITDIKKVLTAKGISVHQIHGPFCAELTDRTEEDRAISFEKKTKGMVMAKYLGAKYMAVHPLTPYGIGGDRAEEVVEINRAYYTALAKVAGKLGIVLCLENLPFVDFPLSRVEDVCDLINEINSPYLKMTFDAGHANIFEGRISDKLRYAGELVKIIHAHDNDGTGDQHLVPYDGTVDWADFAEGLFDIGFDGVFNFETAPVYKKNLDAGMTDDEVLEAELSFAKLAKLLAG